MLPHRCTLSQIHQSLNDLYWYSGVPVIAGTILIAFDLFVLLPNKRASTEVCWDPPGNLDLTVVLTAYNDAESIGLAVEDFRSHARVKRVVVVDNNSRDGRWRIGPMKTWLLHPHG